MDKQSRVERWAGSKAKHNKDGNHGKHGFVGGNVRYDRQNPDSIGNRSMGRARASRF